MPDMNHIDSHLSLPLGGAILSSSSEEGTSSKEEGNVSKMPSQDLN